MFHTAVVTALEVAYTVIVVESVGCAWYSDVVWFVVAVCEGNLQNPCRSEPIE